MNRGALAALVKRNAQACEQAEGPRCVCHCGGQFHGKEHGGEWLARTVDDLARRLEDQRTGGQLALALLSLEEEGASRAD